MPCSLKFWDWNATRHDLCRGSCARARSSPCRWKRTSYSWKQNSPRTPGKLSPSKRRSGCGPTRGATEPITHSLGSLQIAIEPVNRSPDGVDLIFALGKTVAFVRIVMNVHGLSSILKNLDDLFGFFFWYADIVIALKNQQRRFRVLDESERRIGFVNGAVFFRISEQRFFVLLQQRVLVLEHGQPVNDSILFYCGRPNVGSFPDRHQRHID